MYTHLFKPFNFRPLLHFLAHYPTAPPVLRLSYKYKHIYSIRSARCSFILFCILRNEVIAKNEIRLRSGKTLKEGERTWLSGPGDLLVPCAYCGEVSELVIATDGHHKRCCSASCRRAFVREYCKKGAQRESALNAIYDSAIGLRTGGFTIDRGRLPRQFVQVVERAYQLRNGGSAWGHSTSHPRAHIEFLGCAELK